MIMERPPPSGETSTDTRSIRQRRRGGSLVNGDLIDRAEQGGYEVLITTDQSMRFQQNLTGGRIAIVVLLSTAWPRVQHPTEETRRAIEEVEPGQFREVPI